MSGNDRLPTTFQSQIPHTSRGRYANLVFPLVVFKKMLELGYELVTGLIWSNFLRRERETDFLAKILLVSLFGVLSLVSYYARAYDALNISIFFTLWYLDYQFAWYQYFHGQQQISLRLKISDQDVTWQTRSHSLQLLQQLTFPIRQIEKITLERTQIKGGAFQTAIALVWRIHIILCDQTALLLYEERAIATAFKKARVLANRFQVPLQLVASEGNNTYSAAPLKLDDLKRSERFPKTIRVQQVGQKWHIFSKWHASSSWLLLGELLRRSGFLLFVLITLNLMIRVGDLLHVAGLLSIGIYHPLESFNANFTSVNFSSFFAWLMSDFDWFGVIECLIILAAMLMRGAYLSKEDHLYIDPNQLTFFLDHQKISQIPTASIEATFFINQPYPMILIVGNNSAIEVDGLQHEREFRAMVWKLDEAIASFQTAAQPDQETGYN